jgi:hypothetical protein
MFDAPSDHSPWQYRASVSRRISRLVRMCLIGRLFETDRTTGLDPDATYWPHRDRRGFRIRAVGGSIDARLTQLHGRYQASRSYRPFRQCLRACMLTIAFE